MPTQDPMPSVPARLAANQLGLPARHLSRFGAAAFAIACAILLLKAPSVTASDWVWLLAAMALVAVLLIPGVYALRSFTPPDDPRRSLS